MSQCCVLDDDDDDDGYVTGGKAGPVGEFSPGQRSPADGREQQVLKRSHSSRPPPSALLLQLYDPCCVSIGFLSTPYTPLDKRAMDNTDEDTTTDDWSLEQPLAQTRTTAIVEVKGAINVVLTPLVAESLDR